MPTFTTDVANIRALVTYTAKSPKDLEIQVDYQRFKFTEVSSYNFPARSDSGESSELTISAFLASDPTQALDIQVLCSGENEQLLGVFASRSAALPDAYVLLVPYQ